MLPDPSWNNTNAYLPDRLLVHQLFETKANEVPDSIAIVDHGKSVTYEELNNLSNQIARSLRAHGVINGSIVGCCLARSFTAIVCMLAVLKSGAAYVLLDSNLPAARLEYILLDSKPSLVIADIDLSDLGNKGDYLIKNIVELTLNSATFERGNLASEMPVNEPAYIAYTSGSTGKPKGVEIAYNSTVNHALAFSSEFKLNSSDRVPLMSPMAFDMAIEEIIPPLMSGCTIVISDSKFGSMAEFTKEIKQNKYTLLNIPSSLWHEWTTYLHFSGKKLPETLMTVIVGSEPVDTKVLRLWQHLDGADRIRWAAAYGTTETTVTSTIHTSADRDDLSNESFVPIGKPIANTVAYILDNNLNQVEVGQQGDLYIGGVGLALRYLNKPELTEEAFIADKFNNDSESKLYKTGDIARYRPDGNIVWTGRSDFQIKIHGLRIEPEEVEAVLNKFPGVAESIVVAKKYYSNEHDKLLVAYVIIEPGNTFDERTLIDKASQHLPGLMVPARIIELNEWPLNTNGKIDRHYLENIALPQLRASSSSP